MKAKLVVAFAGLFLTSLARADSSVTITVDLGTTQLVCVQPCNNTGAQLAIPFSDLDGTLANGQSEVVTILFDTGQSIEYHPPYVSLGAALALETNLSPYPEFASGTGTFLASDGSDLFTPIQLGSADGTDGPNGPGEIGLGIYFPPTFTATGIYGFQFDITYPDAPGVTVTNGELLLNVQPVPEPSSLLLLGMGLVALTGLARRNRTKGQGTMV